MHGLERKSDSMTGAQVGEWIIHSFNHCSCIPKNSVSESELSALTMGTGSLSGMILKSHESITSSSSLGSYCCLEKKVLGPMANKIMRSRS